jgi:peptidoglycan-associated lipoprotein
MQIGIATKVFASSLIISLLASCSSTSTISDAVSTADLAQPAATSAALEDSNAVEQRAAEEAAAVAAQEAAAAAQEAAAAAQEAAAQKAAALAAQQQEDQRKALPHTIYFDFDQSMIKAEFRKVLDSHAAYLINNLAVSLILEGHADEHGTREYNMALGERRGNAVSRYLVVQGVSSSAIEVISFGEERPVSIGSWSENRRVQIKYLDAK